MKRKLENGRPKIGLGGPIGPPFGVWRLLQDDEVKNGDKTKVIGQGSLIRWGLYHKRYPGTLRKQSGHDHMCSISFLVNYFLIKMRPIVKLEEMLPSRCAQYHDVSEGLTGVDHPAPSKRDEHDLEEYLIFERHFKTLGEDVWADIQRCFLLQFALRNPLCFPTDAREVMTILARDKRNEALFFRGLELFDYLMFAQECHEERGNETLLKEVSLNYFAELDRIANEFAGFRQVVWTIPVREYFGSFCRQGTMPI